MDLSRLSVRSDVVKLIRRFFDERGYTEMHTPRLVGLPGQEPHLEPFWTAVSCPNTSYQLQATSYSAALITSPEYAMKRLLAAGMDKIYDLGPCFRNNEPWDVTHDPEFLMLEWYRKDADLFSLMDETEEMVKWVSTHVQRPENVQRPTSHVPRQEPGHRTYNPFQPFRRLTVEDAWREYLGVELSPLLDDLDGIRKLAISLDQTVDESDTWDDLYFKIFLTHIEPKLGLVDPNYELRTTNCQPVFLYRYPTSQAALAKRCSDDPRYADRVELYIGGLELANGFVELADADEQRKRFEEEQALRQKLGKKTWPLDERFLAALPKMANAAGIAFGVDRFVMLLTGAKSINDVIPFSARDRFVSGKSLNSSCTVCSKQDADTQIFNRSIL